MYVCVWIKRISPCNVTFAYVYMTVFYWLEDYFSSLHGELNNFSINKFELT